jgi:hypothetical protein
MDDKRLSALLYLAMLDADRSDPDDVRSHFEAAIADARGPTDTLRECGREWTIKSQIIHDDLTSLTLHFAFNKRGEPRLHIRGLENLVDNLDLYFNADGTFDGGGSAV